MPLGPCIAEGAAREAPRVSVAILPYGVRPGFVFARMPLARLNWPLGAPADLSGRVQDLTADDHIIAYPSSDLLYYPRPGVTCNISVMIVEPQAVHGRKMSVLRYLHRRFYRVLTCNRALLSAIPNGAFFAYGSTWIPDWRTVDCSKREMLSIIASARAFLEGHRMRHDLISWMKETACDASIMGRGYRPFDNKSDGHAPYRYSVVIENVRERGYFTEKLIDALLCETVPIYVGAPDIADFFDARGMILCDTLDDLKRAVADLSQADYESRLDFVKQNRITASRYADHEKRAAAIVEESLQSRKGETGI